MLIITPRIRIPESELEFSFVRSSGPGGQNVNKVNSKAVLRWNVRTSPSLDLESRSWLANRLASKLTESGELVLTSDRFRDQIRNRADCVEKFRELLVQATFVQKRRKETRPTFSSKKRAQTDKKSHSHKKSMRRSPRGGDD